MGATQQLQWAYAQLTAPSTMMPTLGTPGTGYKASNAGGTQLSLFSEKLPYTVPTGFKLGIQMAQFACKISEPGSYLVLQARPQADPAMEPANVFSLPGHCPLIVFPIPLLLPSGSTLNCRFINNSTWDQFMTMLLMAVLIPE